MELKLPSSIISFDDIEHIIRVLENRESQFISAQTAGTGLAAATNNKNLDDLAALNNLNLSDRRTCQWLKSHLESLAKGLPRLHVSFATEPSQAVVEKLVVWLRSTIHPGVLIKIGLQPSIAAGCVIRTPNKIFDLSLSHYIKQQDEYLIRLIKGAVNAK